MEIVLLQPENLEDVLMIEHICFSVPWSRQAFESQIGNAHAVFLMGYEEGVPVGFIGMQHVLEIGDITNVAVLPAFREMGYGTQFLRAMEQHALALGLETLLLEVRESNDAARSLYAKNGFEPVGRRKNYYEKPREDAILMGKMIAPAGLLQNTN